MPFCDARVNTSGHRCDGWSGRFRGLIGYRTEKTEIRVKNPVCLANDLIERVRPVK